MKSSKVLQDISSNVEGKMSNCDARNWVSYVNGFRKCFKQLEVEVADLRRFPTGNIQSCFIFYTYYPCITRTMVPIQIFIILQHDFFRSERW